MSEYVKGEGTFTKRTRKYGLLRRAALPDKPWSFVNFARFLFDELHQAHEKASYLNTESDTPAYLYKPVEVWLEVEVDDWKRKEQCDETH